MKCFFNFHFTSIFSAKCYHIEQKSQDPTSFDPTDRSMSNVEQRFNSASPSVVTVQSLPPMHLISSSTN